MPPAVDAPRVAEIAQQLTVVAGTLKTHVAGILMKRDLRDRTRDVVLPL